MSTALKTSFSSLALPTQGTVVFLTDETISWGSEAQAFDKKTDGVLRNAVKALDYKGKRASLIDLVTPANTKLDRALVIGAGKISEFKNQDWVALGGAIATKLIEKKVEDASVVVEIGKTKITNEICAALLLGAKLATYRFDKFKSKTKDEEKLSLKKLTLLVGDVAGAKKASANVDPTVDGVNLARELVNLPPNVLGPVEFAATCANLKKLGVKVTILTEKEMSKLGMNALLGVGQGSAKERGSRLAVMEWNGAAKNQKPVAIVGKGVVFDTGGISLKPGQNMEDMKGDMAGAACVTGLMHTLAARKAKANVVGVVGLVENMPDGNAQRPGDIVTSMSGQTIEIINTDAEGRLVLADALWYTQDKFKPQVMINLATLTGAIIIALGVDHAGMFSNNDELSERLTAVGKETGEKLWRMPVSPVGEGYDKLINSKFADMLNSAGREGGSITAAQFLQRFVNNVPWAHLDIAGTGMGVKPSDINKSWGPGFGVRLLDAFINTHYEK